MPLKMREVKMVILEKIAYRLDELGQYTRDKKLFVLCYLFSGLYSITYDALVDEYYHYYHDLTYEKEKAVYSGFSFFAGFTYAKKTSPFMKRE